MAATDTYPNVPSTFSNIIDDNVQQPAAPPSPNSILLLGTATKGPLHKATKLDDTNITDVFGDEPSAYGNLSLIRNYREVQKISPQADVYAIRIGNSTRGQLNLYENRHTTSGDLGYQATDTIAMSITAKEDGFTNNTSVEIYGDDNGLPSLFTLTTPTAQDPAVTTDYDFVLNPSGYFNGGGGLVRTSELVDALNANTDFSTHSVASLNVLIDTVDVTITANTTGAASGTPELNYDLTSSTTVSYGDKLIDIITAQNSTPVTDTAVLSGDITRTLTYKPAKDTNAATATITRFMTVKTNETVMTAAAANIGDTTLYLDCRDDSHWDSSDGTYNITNSEFTLVRNGTTSTLVSGTDYTLNAGSGTLTLITTGASKFVTDGSSTGMRVNDVVYADYKYKTSYVEADTRSELQAGNRYSYFIYGQDIVFGAGQYYNMELVFISDTLYVVNKDIQLTNLGNLGEFKFINPDNYPSIGDTVTLTIGYEPELPAPTVDTTAGNSINFISTTTGAQAKTLSGQSDGTALTGQLLYDELQKGYAASENTPGRYIVPCGVYIDDTIDLVDFETGLSAVGNAGFLEQLSTYVQRKSRYISECFGIISPRPVTLTTGTVTSPSVADMNTWYEKLVTVSTTDTTRAANVLNGFDDYHIVCPTGNINLTTQAGIYYLTTPANIHAAMMQSSDKTIGFVQHYTPIGAFTMPAPIRSLTQKNLINGARYTLYTQDELENYMIDDSPTLARASSKFDRQFVTETVFDIIKAARYVSRPFFGQIGNTETRKSLEQAITNKVNDEFFPDRINAFSCQVFATEADKLSGKTQVLLQITTSKEIRKISFTTFLTIGDVASG